MDRQELVRNIEILESLGWFIAEKEDSGGFDVLLVCCRPDWGVIEEVPVTDFLLSLYDEEDGSLEARLWFFAPKYSTSLDNMEALLGEEGCYEYSVRRELYNDLWYYEGEVTSLGFDDYDGECYELRTETGTSNISGSMALSEAYLRCSGEWDG